MSLIDDINNYLQHITNMKNQVNYMKKILELTDNEDVAIETLKQFNNLRYNYEQVVPYFPFGTEYIYVWELEEGKYYIGWSENLSRRLKEHSTDDGARWTQKYKPKRIIEISLGNKTTENEKTLQYMEKYGWENVRGGSYCQVDMKKPPVALKIKDISNNCLISE